MSLSIALAKRTKVARQGLNSSEGFGCKVHGQRPAHAARGICGAEEQAVPKLGLTSLVAAALSLLFPANSWGLEWCVGLWAAGFAAAGWADGAAGAGCAGTGPDAGPDVAALAGAVDASGPVDGDDAIDWFERTSNGRSYDPAMVQLVMSLAAIHTTTDLVCQTLMDIAQHPEILEPLREEISTILKEEGWRKTSLYKMKLLDSVIKESQRMKPIGISKSM